MTSNPNPIDAGSEGRRGSTGPAAEHVAADVKTVQERAGAAAEEATRQAKEIASEIGGKAKEGASGAAERLRQAAAEQKDAGAERLEGIAAAINRAADELGHDVPQAAEYVRWAARELETFSEAVRERDLRGLAGMVRDFAGRQPAAFLGATMVAGFAAVRFLKVSKPPRHGEGVHQSGSRGTAPPTRPSESSAAVRPVSGSGTARPTGPVSPSPAISPGPVPGGREPSGSGTSNL